MITRITDLKEIVIYQESVFDAEGAGYELQAAFNDSNGDSCIITLVSAEYFSDEVEAKVREIVRNFVSGIDEALNVG